MHVWFVLLLFIHAVDHKIFARSSHGVLVHKSKNFTNI